MRCVCYVSPLTTSSLRASRPWRLASRCWCGGSSGCMRWSVVLGWEWQRCCGIMIPTLSPHPRCAASRPARPPSTRSSTKQAAPSTSARRVVARVATVALVVRQRTRVVVVATLRVGVVVVATATMVAVAAALVAAVVVALAALLLVLVGVALILRLWAAAALPRASNALGCGSDAYRQHLSSASLLAPLLRVSLPPSAFPHSSHCRRCRHRQRRHRRPQLPLLLAPPSSPFFAQQQLHCLRSHFCSSSRHRPCLVRCPPLPHSSPGGRSHCGRFERRVSRFFSSVACRPSHVFVFFQSRGLPAGCGSRCPACTSRRG